MNSLQPKTCLINPSNEFIGIWYSSAESNNIWITFWGDKRPIFIEALMQLWNKKFWPSSMASSYIPKLPILFLIKSLNWSSASFRVTGNQGFLRYPGCLSKCSLIKLHILSWYWDRLNFGISGTGVFAGIFFLFSWSNDHLPPIGFWFSSIKISNFFLPFW